MNFAASITPKYPIKNGEPPVDLVPHTALEFPEACAPDLDFVDAFFPLLDQGILPAIVLEGKAPDVRYLVETRGNSTLVVFRTVYVDLKE